MDRKEMEQKPKYAKGSFPTLIGSTRIVDITQPGRASVFMANPKPAEPPKNWQ